MFNYVICRESFQQLCIYYVYTKEERCVIMKKTPKDSASHNHNQSLANNNELIKDESRHGNKNGEPRDDKMTTDTLERRIGMDEETTRAVTSTVQKWGNSLAVRIPKDMANHKAFNQGTVVEIIETDDGLKIVLKKKKVEYSLTELLSQCKPENRHETIDFGVAGKEMI